MSFWIKPETIRGAIFPQLPSFCGVAVAGGAANALLGTGLSQEQLHESYGIGEITKLRIAPGPLPDDLKSRLRVGAGMSNWDVIRLFNSILLDAGREPHTAVLCGADFVRETAEEAGLAQLLDWSRQLSSQVVIHIVGHYVLLAGQLVAGGRLYLVTADSSIKKGPLRSLSFSEVKDLAASDERYGWVLLSDGPIPEDLFSLWTEAMRPPETRRRERFVRKDTSS